MHLNVQKKINFALAFEVFFFIFYMHANTCSLLIRLLIEVENIFEFFKDINVSNSLRYIYMLKKIKILTFAYKF